MIFSGQEAGSLFSVIMKETMYFFGLRYIENSLLALSVKEPAVAAGSSHVLNRLQCTMDGKNKNLIMQRNTHKKLNMRYGSHPFL